MTWSARFTDAAGKIPEGAWSACQKCKYGQFDFATSKSAQRQIKPCSLSNVSNPLASLMTSIDVGADGHMAGGTADLKCSGFELMEE